MAEDRIVKYCAQVGSKSISLVMTNCPMWAWSSSRDVLILWQINVNIVVSGM